VSIVPGGPALLPSGEGKWTVFLCSRAKNPSAGDEYGSNGDQYGAACHGIIA
jgi:hypothetical protein